MDLPDNRVDHFMKLTRSFGPDAPRIVLMSGGEALLKPRAVAEIAATCTASGVGSYLLSGMFFATNSRIPDRIRAAIDSVDHFAASLDRFHEEEVSRRAVLNVLAQLHEEGKDVSLQLVGMDDTDPYLADAVADVESVLGREVPVLVGHVGPVGRAKDWMAPVTYPVLGSVTADPCEMATWPVVRHDGTVVACVNQDVIDADAPPDHLVIGDACREEWSTIADRLRGGELLRAIRTVGPRLLAGSDAVAGKCVACRCLSGTNEVMGEARRWIGGNAPSALEVATARLLEDAGPRGFAQRNGSVAYADLVLWGAGSAGAVS